MGRLLTLLLGAAVVFGLAYYTLRGASPLRAHEDPNAQGLQPVRKEAKRIEDDAQRRADETLNKASE
ncbi:MAG TPA: hypothetical protein VND93_28860 [Myxococcales bacterium]|jgi:hypothetical protein|nr:hypothetical protein [Myxococcales bacterium]